MFQAPIPEKKTKVLVLSDHMLQPSGVGSQTLALFTGLVNTGKYKIISLGGALKHGDYRTMQPHPDIVIKPVNGYGSKEQLRHLLLTEKPDMLFIFTDPRQFIWTWEMEDEIHQLCPISYWHVWDNGPYPEFNKLWYESTDVINCLSHKTYEMVKPHFVNKTNYIPHAFSKEQYFPVEPSKLTNIVREQFPGKENWFKVLWVNRNAHRKVPADVINSFSDFLNALETKHGHRNAMLILHTDPYDMEGPNLVEVGNHFGIMGNIVYSSEKLPVGEMNVLHNISDVLINVAKNEGFGLSTLIQMMVGKPIIALCTGGLTRQVIDYRDGTENGVAIKPVVSQLMGSQQVPYIYEDYANHQQVVDALMKIYEMTPSEKEKMKSKVLEYCDHEFNYEKMVADWDKTIQESIQSFRTSKKVNWTLKRLENSRYQKPKTSNEQLEQVFKQNNIVISNEVKALPLNLTAFLMKNIILTEVQA